MMIIRKVVLALAGALFTLVSGTATLAPASAAELVYGSWPPAGTYINKVALPEVFKRIEAETKGAIKWRLVPGGQLANAQATFQAVTDGLMQGGFGISTYVPNLIPSVNTIYRTIVFGDDVVAASGAALETFTLNCPSCLAEARKLNLVPLSGWTTSPYYLACRTPISKMSDLKGKRVNISGTSPALMLLADAVPINVTLIEAVPLLNKGGLDCTLGAHAWLKTYGYADVVKHITDYPLGLSGPAIGLMINRTTWNGFTREQKLVHLRQAAYFSAGEAIGQFMDESDAILKDVMETKGVKIVKANQAEFDTLAKKFVAEQRQQNIADAKGFGVADPAAIIDAYDRARTKWAGLSKGIGRDVGKFTEVIWREVYSKVDADRF